MRLFLILCGCLLSLSVLAQPIEYAEKISIQSKAFDEQRILRVALPATYASISRIRYPVIYVVRGQLDLFTTVASLDLLDAEVPEFIVVGIDGALGDFFPSRDGSQTNYSRFIHDEVIPHIEKTYRTAPYNVLLGHSMAAIFVMSDWFENGKSFSKYIAISPPLDGGQLNQKAKTLSKAQLAEKHALLVTMASEGELAQAKFTELGELLSASARSTFQRFPQQTHMSTRANAIMHGLREEFAGWKFPLDTKDVSFADLKQHYQNLSKRYGFEVEVPLDMLMRMSGFQSLSTDPEQNKNALAAVKYTLARNANDVDELFEIVEQTLSFNGGKEGSKRLISYICDELPNDLRCK